MNIVSIGVNKDFSFKIHSQKTIKNNKKYFLIHGRIFELGYEFLEITEIFSMTEIFFMFQVMDL